MKAYEEMMEHSSTEYAPWYCAPADNKWFTRFVVSDIVKRELEAVDPGFPGLADEEEAVLDEYRRLSEKGSNTDSKRKCIVASVLLPLCYVAAQSA